MKNEKTNSKAKKAALYVLYGTITVLFLIAILSFNDIDEIFTVLGKVQPRYVALSFLTIAIYVALYPLSLCILTKARGCDIKMRRTYSIAMTEHFFNGITPFATGGQPFQAYAFAKAKVKPTESTCLLLMNFMVFMLVTNGFAACALFYFRRLVTDGAMAAIAVIGFAMNFIVLALTFLIATSHRVCELLCKIVDFFCRFKIIARFLESKRDTLKEYFVNVQTAFAALKRKKGAFFLALLTKILSMAAYYSTTFFILRALGVAVGVNEIFFVICASSFAITMVVFLPTPGSSGGIEFAFKTIFAQLAGAAAIDAIAYGGMLVWRLLTYYFVMLISFLFYIALEIIFSRDKRREACLSEPDSPLQKTEGEVDVNE